MRGPMPATDIAERPSLAHRYAQIERVAIPLLALALWLALPATWSWDPELRWLFGGSEEA